MRIRPMNWRTFVDVMAWLAATAVMTGCTYTTTSPNGAKYTVIHQPSLTSAPGLTHLEKDGVYVNTWAGGSFLGEVAGGAGAAASGMDQQTNVVSGYTSETSGGGGGWYPPGQVKK